MDCPHCGRPVAVVRPSCFYCGKPLPREVVAATRATAEEAIRKTEHGLPAAAETSPSPPATTGPDRSLLVLDLREASVSAVAAALGTSAFEAGQRMKRGGYQLHRIVPAAEAAAEAENIAGHGLRVYTLSEAELHRHAALTVERGRLEPQRFLGRAGGRAAECAV